MKIETKLTLHASSLRVFKSKRQAKVIYVKVQYEALWMDVFDLVNKICTDLGLVKRCLDYTPHITLGRIRRVIGKQLINGMLERFDRKFTLLQSNLEICVYESILKKSGPQYNVLFKKSIS